MLHWTQLAARNIQDWANNGRTASVFAQWTAVIKRWSAEKLEGHRLVGKNIKTGNQPRRALQQVMKLLREGKQFKIPALIPRCGFGQH
jgi:hypothetical protein